MMMMMMMMMMINRRVIAKVMINPENSNYGKSDVRVRRILCLVFGGRGRPPCHS